eukprot:Nk52_evm1s1537 gene=Nk52_evmTU1s1537
MNPQQQAGRQVPPAARAMPGNISALPRAGGLAGAPLTKGLLWLTGSLTVLSRFASGRLPMWGLPQSLVISVGGLFVSPLVYGSTSELLLGSLLLYNMRVFERRYGSRKFAAYLLSATLISGLFEWIINGIGGGALFSSSTRVRSSASNNYLYRGAAGNESFNSSQGPRATLFALLLNYFCDIPWTESFPIPFFSSSSSTSSSAESSGIALFSDKSFTYFWAFQFFFSAFPHSILPSTSGLLAGLVLRLIFLSSSAGYNPPKTPASNNDGTTTTATSNNNNQTNGSEESMWLPDRLIPGWLANFCQAHLKPLLEDDQDLDVDHPQTSSLQTPLGRSGVLNRPPMAAPTVQPQVEPLEEHVEAITSMGFTREQAQQALRRANNNLQAATNALLDS